MDWIHFRWKLPVFHDPKLKSIGTSRTESHWVGISLDLIILSWIAVLHHGLHGLRDCKRRIGSAVSPYGPMRPTRVLNVFNGTNGAFEDVYSWFGDRTCRRWLLWLDLGWNCKLVKKFAFYSPYDPWMVYLPTSIIHMQVDWYTIHGSYWFCIFQLEGSHDSMSASLQWIFSSAKHHKEASHPLGNWTSEKGRGPGVWKGPNMGFFGVFFWGGWMKC